jgi:hypothetical protein
MGSGGGLLGKMYPSAEVTHLREGNMGAAAAIIIRRQRDIVETFQGARATSVQTARHPGELGVEEDRIFRGLIRRAVIRPSEDGRYYLDEPSWVALGSMRRRIALMIMLLVILAGATIFFSQYTRVAR